MSSKQKVFFTTSMSAGPFRLPGYKSPGMYTCCSLPVCYTIHVGVCHQLCFGLVFSSEYMLLLVAGGYLIAIPPYLIAEWLSNKRSFSRCLMSPESSHDEGK